MSRRVQFFGIAALVVLVFGLLTNLIISYDDYLLVPIHLTLAGVFLIVFVVKGGLHFLRSAAAKRAAGFGFSATFYTVVFLGLLFLANYAAARHQIFHVDSTEQKVFTLAQQTVETLDALPEPVTARAFFVGKIDAETEGLLDRLARASDKFKWVWIDPEKKPTLMETYGISESKTIHFSIGKGTSRRESKVTRKVDEETIVNALRKLLRSGDRVVYALGGHGEGDLKSPADNGFLFLKEAMEGQNVEVKELLFPEQGAVPKDASLVLLLAPRKSLLPPERAAIEDYLKAGGSAILVNEPKTVDDIAEMAKPLGINVGKNVVLDQEMRVFAGPGIGVRPMVTRYGVHPALKDFSEGTVYTTASSVARAANVPAGAQITELAFTGVNSWAETDLDKLYSEKPIASRDPEDLRGPVPVAAAFEGPYPTGHFSREGENNAASDSSTKPKTRVVVLGDSDFVSNGGIRNLANGDFFLGLMNWALGEEKGVSITARSMRQSVNVLTDEQFSTIFVMTGIVFPELLLLLGLGVWWFRKK